MWRRGGREGRMDSHRTCAAAVYIETEEAHHLPCLDHGVVVKQHLSLVFGFGGLGFKSVAP